MRILALESLADKMPMSVSLLIEFSKIYGRFTVRLCYGNADKKAKYLLRSTELTITAVPYETGFNSEANFIYVFTKNVGVSPGKFRKLKNENAA